MNELEKQLYGSTLAELTEALSKYRRLEACWRLIQSDYGSEELGLGEVSERCGISETHLNRLLNETIGLSFQELLHRYRLQMACRMLSEKDYNLLEVALETGFGNPSSLRRYFQTVLGSTPREYRGRCRPPEKPVNPSRSRRTDAIDHRLEVEPEAQNQP